MIDYDKFMNGTVKYIEDEILHKISGYQKWLLGTAVGIGIKRIDNMYDKIVENPVVDILGLVDDNDMIDDDIIYEELKKQAHNNPITIEIPMIRKNYDERARCRQMASTFTYVGEYYEV